MFMSVIPKTFFASKNMIDSSVSTLYEKLHMFSICPNDFPLLTLVSFYLQSMRKLDWFFQIAFIMSELTD